MTKLRFALPLVAACVALATAACPSSYSRTELLDPSSMPEGVREDYAVFAVRCSKCHSLARPLSSGIVDDDYWSMYVARMRRQPGSGISEDDARVILRFLHWYSLDQKQHKAQRAHAADETAGVADAALPDVAPSPPPLVEAPLREDAGP